MKYKVGDTIYFVENYHGYNIGERVKLRSYNGGYEPMHGHPYIPDKRKPREGWFTTEHHAYILCKRKKEIKRLP